MSYPNMTPHDDSTGPADRLDNGAGEGNRAEQKDQDDAALLVSDIS